MADSATPSDSTSPTVAEAEEALSEANARCEATKKTVTEARMEHQRALAAVNRATTNLWRARNAAKSKEPN